VRATSAPCFPAHHKQVHSARCRQQCLSAEVCEKVWGNQSAISLAIAMAPTPIVAIAMVRILILAIAVVRILIHALAVVLIPILALAVVPILIFAIAVVPIPILAIAMLMVVLPFMREVVAGIAKLVTVHAPVIGIAVLEPAPCISVGDIDWARTFVVIILITTRIEEQGVDYGANRRTNGGVRAVRIRQGWCGRERRRDCHAGGKGKREKAFEGHWVSSLKKVASKKRLVPPDRSSSCDGSNAWRAKNF
jgi:hypothetical protein